MVAFIIAQRENDLIIASRTFSSLFVSRKADLFGFITHARRILTCFYYVASSPGFPLPHLLDGHRGLVRSSAISASLHTPAATSVFSGKYRICGSASRWNARIDDTPSPQTQARTHTHVYTCSYTHRTLRHVKMHSQFYLNLPQKLTAQGACVSIFKLARWCTSENKYTTLQHTATHWLQHNTAHYNTMQHRAHLWKCEYCDESDKILKRNPFQAFLFHRTRDTQRADFFNNNALSWVLRVCLHICPQKNLFSQIVFPFSIFLKTQFLLHAFVCNTRDTSRSTQVYAH